MRLGLLLKEALALVEGVDGAHPKLKRGADKAAGGGGAGKLHQGGARLAQGGQKALKGGLIARIRAEASNDQGALALLLEGVQVIGIAHLGVNAAFGPPLGERNVLSKGGEGQGVALGAIGERLKEALLGHAKAGGGVGGAALALIGGEGHLPKGVDGRVDVAGPKRAGLVVSMARSAPRFFNGEHADGAIERVGGGVRHGSEKKKESERKKRGGCPIIAKRPLAANERLARKEGFE